MSRKLALAAGAAIMLAGAAQPPAAPTPQFSADAFRAHVTYLADDRLQGRDAGTPGYDIAARYVANRFRELGLRPAAGSDYLQPIRFVEYQLAGAPDVTIDGQRFVHGRDVLVAASPIEGRPAIEAPVVFAGYGLDAPGAGFDDYAGLDVRGKIVALLPGTPKGTRSDLAAHLSSEKWRMAGDRGAIGIVTIPTPAGLQRQTFARMVSSASAPQLTWVQPGGQPFVSAPGLLHAATLNTPAAQALFQGAPVPLATVFAQADGGGRPKGFPLRQRMKIERRNSSRQMVSPNVIAMLPGSDPALANEYVLLTAHLDHVGTTGSGADRIHNGAMDNASGIATMIEAARAFTQSGARPRRTILFAALTAEEDGLLGAQYLAKNPVLPAPAKPVGLLNLDMPVLLYDFQDVIAFGAEHSTLGPIVARATAQANVSVTPDPLPAEGLFTRSDHYRFVQEGVPSVFLMTGFANGGREKFTNFLARHYHQPSDQLDLPFDWNAGAKFARINYLIAREIADAPQAPRWYADSFFGQTFASGALKAAR